MLKEQEAVINREQSFWLGLGVTLAVFAPIFISSKEAFLPAYFTNGFYLALGVVMVGSFLTGVLLLKQRIDWSWNKLDVAVALFALYFLLRFAFSPYAHWFQGRFIWWMVLFGMYGVLWVFFSQQRNQVGIWIGLMLIALSQIIIGQLQLLGLLPAEHGLFKISGTFFNPAPYAGFLAVLFPLALFVVLHKDTILAEWQKCMAYIVDCIL